MKTIYVSGPYSGYDRTVYENIIEAEKVSLKLLWLGWCVITPHKNFSYYVRLDNLIPEVNYEFWLKCCMELLSRCGAIFMMKRWQESKGAMKEWKKAHELELKIYYESDDFPIPEKE